MLELHTLGSVDLLGTEGEEVSGVLSQPKRLALLVYLAVEPGPHRRDTLLTLFWPESDETHARNALSQSLTYLRQYLSEDAFIGRRSERIGLAAGALQSDVEAFDTAIRAGRWATALDLYKGDFLRGFHVAGAWGFEEWAEEERQRLRKAAARAAWSLAQEQVERGALVEARRTAEKALGLVCADESPVREFMSALAGAGDRAAALKFFESYCAVLKRELELEPSSATVGIAEAIRNGEIEAQELLPEVQLSAAEVPIGVREASRGESPKDPAAPATLAPRRFRIRSLATWGVLGVMAVVLVFLGYLGFRGGGREWSPSQAEQRQLTFSGNVGLAALSPDGEYLAYLVGLPVVLDSVGVPPGKLVVRDLGNGAELTIAAGIGPAHDLRWSPDGKWVGLAGFCRGRFGIYLFPRLGGAPRTAPRYAPHFAWSSDGWRLATWWGSEAVVRIQDLEREQVDSVSLSGQSRIAFRGGGDWAPRRDLLALIKGLEGSPSQIALVDLATGTEETLLTDSVQLRSPRWNSTGDTLFFLRGGYLREGELWSIDVDPSRGQPRGPSRRIRVLPGVTDWTNSQGFTFALSFSLSGDGRKLAYTTTFAHTNFSIIAPGGDGGSEPVELTTGTAQKRCPRLSPGGSNIAFLQETTEGWDLFRVSVNGGTPVRLTFSGAVVSDCASWGPDGQRLAVAMAVGGLHRLATVPAMGGTPRIFDQVRMSVELEWAPSSLIAYQIQRNHFRILDPDTGFDTPLIRDPSEWEGMFDPRFSPDGTRLAVHWARRGARGVWVVSWADGSQRRISGIQDFPIGWSRDGQSLFTVDRQGVVRRYPVNGGGAVIIPQPSNRGDALCQPHERANGLSWVCKAERSYSDVWITEGAIGRGP